MSTPVFDSVLRATTFTAFPVEYTDRYTPEVARQQGHKAGTVVGLELAISLLKEVKKPSKQILDIIAKLEEATDE